MSFLSRLFSAPDEVTKITDAVIAAGDKLVFTTEEKSEAAAVTRDWLLRFWEASKGGEVARRLIALMTTGAFLLLLLVAAGLTAAGSPVAPSMVEIAGAFHLPELVGAVFVFYFGKGMIRDFTGGKK